MVYRCSSCGAFLHVFKKVGQDFYGIPSPSEVISWFGGSCPVCGKELRVPTLDSITVMSFKAVAKLLKLREERIPLAIAEYLRTVAGIQLESEESQAGE